MQPLPLNRIPSRPCDREASLVLGASSNNHPDLLVSMIGHDMKRLTLRNRLISTRMLVSLQRIRMRLLSEKILKGLHSVLVSVCAS